MRKIASLVLLVSLTLVAACSSGGGDDLSDAEQAYADSIAIGLRDGGDGFDVDDDELDCMAEAVVRGLGIDLFEEHDVAPEAFEDGQGPAEILGSGVVDEDAAEAVVDDWLDCTDLAQVVAESGSEDLGLDEEGIECLSTGLREDDLIRSVLLPTFTEADGEPTDDSVVTAFLALIQECAGDDAIAGLGASGGDLSAEVAAGLAAQGNLTEEQATCMANAILDALSEEDLAALAEGGSTEDVPPATALAVLSAATDCGVTSLGDLAG